MLDPAAMSVAARQVGEWNVYLASIPLDDHAQARAASRSTAMFAAWSTRLAPNEKAFPRSSADAALGGGDTVAYAVSR